MIGVVTCPCVAMFGLLLQNRYGEDHKDSVQGEKPSMAAVMEAIHKSPRFSFEGACQAIDQSTNANKEEPCS